MKKILAGFIAVVLIISCGTFIVSRENGTAVADGSANVRAAVLGTDGTADKIYNQLTNAMIANINVTKIENSKGLLAYDIVYIDNDSANYKVSEIEDYVQNGGTVVLSSSLIDDFSNEFLGASEIVDIMGCPADISFPSQSERFSDISKIIYDYSQVFKDYVNIDKYSEYSYGNGIIPSTAESIADYNGTAIYTFNEYGKGNVFVTNPYLPSEHTVTSLDNEDEKGQPFAFTTVAADNIIRSCYAEYVSKQLYGFAIQRTFGSYGTKSAAWELHYEDITGIENNSLETFARLCMSKGQMPSYTMARNFYTWFKRAESLTYLKGGENGFINDSYEDAYCSGTHVVSAGKWLELDSYEKTESYFEDDKKYTKRLYPLPIDWDEDGTLDFICGSADGKFYYFKGNGLNPNFETAVSTVLTDSDGDEISVGAYSSPAIADVDGDGRGELISGSESGVIKAFKTLKAEENPNSMAFESIGTVIDTGLTDSMIDTGDLNNDGITDIAVGSRDGEMRVYFGKRTSSGGIMYMDYIPVDSKESWASPCIFNGELYGGTLQGYVAKYGFNGNSYQLLGYLKYDDISRRGSNRVTIGMNCVPRFADIDNDGIDDLICGSLEYGMAYPIDSSYFPYEDELREQIEFCNKNNIYIGVHGFTNKYATPEHEKKELQYHKEAFNKYGLTWDGVGANQHTWFVSQNGEDNSGINGYNPSYDGTFKAQYDSGLLWNSGFTPPESSQVPQISAENSIPMPMYLPNEDYLLMQVSNTPHGDGKYSYESVSYGMPMLFYNHCDYIYEDNEENQQEQAVAKVGKLIDNYGYMFVREDQMAKAAAATYNTEIRAEKRDGDIIISGVTRDYARKLYDSKYSDCVAVKVVFADNADKYKADCNVQKSEDDTLMVTLDKTVTISENIKNNNLNIEGINSPANIKLKGSSAEVKFKENGIMIACVKGDAATDDAGWTVTKRNGKTTFLKFGKSQKLNIKAE